MMFPFANMYAMNNPNFINMNMNMNQAIGNDITEQEIQKHKKTLNDLIMKLNNTHNIDEEISINNEIRKETEFLSSLFNIKKNEFNNQNLNVNYQMQTSMNNNIIPRMTSEIYCDKDRTEIYNDYNYENNINENIVSPKINIIFYDNKENEVDIKVNYGATINQLLELYLKSINRLDLIEEDEIIMFFHNGRRLKFGDMKIVEYVFGNGFTKILVKREDNLIYRLDQYKNIIFKTSNEIKRKMSVYYDRPIGWLLKYYLVVVKKPELIKDDNNRIFFIYNSSKINFNNRTTIKEFFKHDDNPTIIVHYPGYEIQ